MARSKSNPIGTLAVATAGAAVGAAAATLLNKNSRKKITNKAKDAVELGASKIEEAKEMLMDASEKSREMANGQKKQKPRSKKN